MSWIFKVIDTSSLLKISYLKGFLTPDAIKEYLQEDFVLLNLMRNFLGEDATAKSGTYSDVV